MIFDDLNREYDVVAVQENGKTIVKSASILMDRTVFHSENELDLYIRENHPGKSYFVLESING